MAKGKRTAKQHVEERRISKMGLPAPLPVTALNDKQKEAFNHFSRDMNLVLHGSAGTGKTFIALAMALQMLFDESTPYTSIVIVRNTVAIRDMGFLPGNVDEKVEIYELPYKAIFSEMFRNGSAYSILKQKDLVQFVPTSFVRGITMNNCIVVCDEMQNWNFHELDSVITRLGKDCKVIFSGDYKQSDLTDDDEKKDILSFLEILEGMYFFESVEFTSEDIVRSELVKQYIIEKEKRGL